MTGDLRARLAAAGPSLLAGELAVFALWGAVAPPLAGPLDLVVDGRAGVEAADEVLPALVALGVASVALVAARRARAGWLLAAASGAVMTATHAAYLAGAARGDVDAVAAAFLAAPGIAVLVLGLTAAATGAIPIRPAAEATSASASPPTPLPAPMADPVPDDPLIA
ncbi:MAG TPA: hypothetical protein VFO60_01425 [Candidatus Dormibacteraeota bacterium]|nr:hypothetical protein [Candidatus Dormibacteraeota bacterium]